MFPQIACPCGYRVTLVAFVQLFSTVRFQMIPQSECVRGCIITLVAFVWLFPTACFQVSERQQDKYILTHPKNMYETVWTNKRMSLTLPSHVQQLHFRGGKHPWVHDVLVEVLFELLGLVVLKRPLQPGKVEYWILWRWWWWQWWLWWWGEWWLNSSTGDH